MGANIAVKIEFEDGDLDTLFKSYPKKIERINRDISNQVATELAESLGTKIAKESRTQIKGFKRVRVKKSRATRRRARSSVWLGGNRVYAKYGGRLRKGSGGAYAGSHFFKGGFIATMKTGYRSIFFRKQGSRKLKEATFKVVDMAEIVNLELLTNKPKWESVLASKVKAIL